MADEPWVPPFTWEERLKYAFLPARMSMRRIVRKKLRRGERELHLLPFLVDRAKSALDIGAHRGVYTHLLARLCTKVHAFEPNPKNVGVLLRALPENAEAHAVALSNEAGTAVLRVPESKHGYSNQGGSLAEPMAERKHREIQVEAKRLDDYDLRDVGFVKIDVEGFEEAVLEGGAETIRRERPVMLIEMEERHTGRPIEASLALVADLGYAGFFLRDWQLTSVEHLDPDADHRERVGRDGYVFNFVFLPRGS